MAESCSGKAKSSLEGIQAWYIRDETYSAALTELVNAQKKRPLAAFWGNGTTSLSYGQNFRVGSHGRYAGQVNLKYNLEPAVQIYTHIFGSAQRSGAGKSELSGQRSDFADCGDLARNTVYIERGIDSLKRKGLPLNEHLIAHLSTPGWEHINLSEDHIWRTNRKLGQVKYRTLPRRKRRGFLLRLGTNAGLAS